MYIAMQGILGFEGAYQSPFTNEREYLRMADFSTPFSVKNSDRKLTKSELIRAVRLMIVDEYEAVQVYTQLAESIDDELARDVLLDIADEEKVHAGEFLRLLKELAPDEAAFYDQGAREVEDVIAAMKTGAESGSALAEGTTIGSLKE
jgi:rubrerythrin